MASSGFIVEGSILNSRLAEYCYRVRLPSSRLNKRRKKCFLFVCIHPINCLLRVRHPYFAAIAAASDHLPANANSVMGEVAYFSESFLMSVSFILSDFLFCFGIPRAGCNVSSLRHQISKTVRLGNYKTSTVFITHRKCLLMQD
jgi:hypothetical protein